MVKWLYQLGMARLLPVAPAVFHATSSLRLPGFVHFPIRMTVLRTARGVVVVSPIEIDDALAAEVDALGPVRAIVAPNALHHLFLDGARRRWPGARLLGAPALRDKRKDLAFDGALDDIDEEIEVVRIDGAPVVDEHVLLHGPSRTLVVTDLVFNVHRAANVVTWFVFAIVAGAYRRLGQSRMWRFFTKDRAAAAASLRRVLAWDFDRLVVAHGDVVESGAKAALEAATRWMAPSA